MTDQLLVVPTPDTASLVAEARRLADALTVSADRNVEVVAVAMAGICEPDAPDARLADERLTLERASGAFETGSAGVRARVRALQVLVADRDPLAVLLPSTPDGDEIAARLAPAVGGANLVGSLLQVRDGDLVGGRPVFDGRAFATYDATARPLVASLLTEGLPEPDADPDSEPVASTRTVEVADDDGVERLDVVEIPETDIARATGVVAGGDGIEGPAGFGAVEDLADALGATLGASRPPVDEGLVAYDRQIGVTGKPVDADLYVPCAISGDPYHMGAVEADHLVPINTDPDARIFDFADLGIVGDVAEYAPAIAEAVREARDEESPEPAAVTGGGEA